jgi:hypothetical protein
VSPASSAPAGSRSDHSMAVTPGPVDVFVEDGDVGRAEVQPIQVDVEERQTSGVLGDHDEGRARDQVRRNVEARRESAYEGGLAAPRSPTNAITSPAAARRPIDGRALR